MALSVEEGIWPSVTIATVACGGPGFDYPNKPGAPRWIEFDNRGNKFTPCQAYQMVLEQCNTDILIMGHDDVTVHDPEWCRRILGIFAGRPECAAVGLGGAAGLGSLDLYRKPYNIWNLARRGYVSNQTDWEVHGGREEGDKQVVVLDAFCMAVRRDWLVRRGGWPVEKLTHHCLYLWLGCEAARDGKEVWMTGSSCTHHGGGSSTKPVYVEAKWLQAGTLEGDHQSPHRWLFEQYRDVLPLEIP